MPLRQVYLASSLIFLTYLMPWCAVAWSEMEPAMVLEKMEQAYDKVKDYQANVEVRTSKSDGSFDTEKFLYTFKKPEMIRLDFESPHSGMILVYPDRNRKVVVRPWPFFPFFKLHLDPGDPILVSHSGQHIDQTDLGLLIRNIGHSLTDQSRGPPEVTEKDGTVEIQVLAENHFRKGILTIYRFSTDEELWLPVKVEESDSAGRLERTMIFRNLRTNIGIPESSFRLAGD
jgi:outer membrane lipoprotein-sorting protein